MLLSDFKQKSRVFSDLKEKSRYFPSREKNLQQPLFESEMPTLP
jgi:hypothetical protein